MRMNHTGIHNMEYGGVANTTLRIYISIVGCSNDARQSQTQNLSGYDVMDALLGAKAAALESL